MGYGGLERVVSEYSQGFTELGHDVSVVASRDSEVLAGVKLIDTVKPWDKLVDAERQSYAKLDKVWNGWRAHEEASFRMYKDLIDSFDVIGDHSWSKWSYITKKEEIVGTCHSIKPYNIRPPRPHPLLTGVSIGHSRFLSRELHVPVRAIHNPVNVEELPFQRDKSERILSLNRIMPQKGIHLFLDAVEKEKLKADVAGDDSTLVPDQNYVNFIKDRCKKSAFANYYGLVDDQTRINLLKNARALICLKDGGYEEVFGLQAVEALACGTPVIALKSWGFNDTIEHGKNGYLCDNMEQVGESLRKIDVIKPEYCRESVKKFSREVRGKVYSNMMESVKKGNRW